MFARYVCKTLFKANLPLKTFVPASTGLFKSLCGGFRKQQQCHMGGITKGHNLLEDDGLKSSIKAFGDTSFLVNNVLARQSVILFPNSFVLWNVKSFDELTVDSLSVFATLYPTIEVLFIGCGERMPRQLPKDITDYFSKRGIIVEASDTVNAASTFNVLNAEGRHVAAALITMEPYSDAFPED